MLRNSIRYACEAYYDLMENDLRQLEWIAEMFLRTLFEISKESPISQLYQEVGHNPARFQISKTPLLFLKNILHEVEDSLIIKMFMLQIQKPIRGDWYSSCMKYLDDFNKTMSRISPWSNSQELLTQQTRRKPLNISFSREAVTVVKYLTLVWRWPIIIY